MEKNSYNRLYNERLGGGVPEVSVVIVSYNDQKFLFPCLDSIYKNSNGHNLEIIVIDNGSTVSIAKELKKRFPGVRLIENDKNLGFAKATNQGIKASRGRYIVALNSDTVLLANALALLVRFMNGHQGTAAAGAKILNPQGMVQPTCRRFPTYLTGLFNRTSLLTRLFPHNHFSRRYLLSHWDHKDIRSVDWVAGTYILFRREAIEDVGYLDEDYFMYCEEIDWCYRAKQKGWKIYYVPQAEIIHYQKNSMHTKIKVILHHKSMLRFYRKHLKTPFAFYIFIAAGIFLKVIGLFLLYDLGMAFNVLYKTRRVSQRLSSINA